MGYPILGGRGYLTGFNALTATSITTTGNVAIGGDMNITGVSTAVGGHSGYSRLLPVSDTADSASMVTVSGRCYAYYVGQAPKTLTTIDVECYIHGVPAVPGAGGASVNWAEVGIATGTYENYTGGASTDLTILAATSIDTQAQIAATAGYQNTLTAAITVDAGIWVVIAGAYEVTQMSCRTGDGSDIRGAVRYRAATKPSGNIGSPLAFTGTPGTALQIPWLRARVA